MAQCTVEVRAIDKLWSVMNELTIILSKVRPGSIPKQ